VVDQAIRAHGALPHAHGGQPPPGPSRPPWTRRW
jgi:hypothetical protein